MVCPGRARRRLQHPRQSGASSSVRGPEHVPGSVRGSRRAPVSGPVRSASSVSGCTSSEAILLDNVDDDDDDDEAESRGAVSASRRVLRPWLPQRANSATICAVAAARITLLRLKTRPGGRRRK
jgi:hypothetical protein